MMIDTDAQEAIKTSVVFVLWVVLMTLAGCYGRG
jgi:hypothetical protein